MNDLSMKMREALAGQAGSPTGLEELSPLLSDLQEELVSDDGNPQPWISDALPALPPCVDAGEFDVGTKLSVKALLEHKDAEQRRLSHTSSTSSLTSTSAAAPSECLASQPAHWPPTRSAPGSVTASPSTSPLTRVVSRSVPIPQRSAQPAPAPAPGRRGQVFAAFGSCAPPRALLKAMRSDQPHAAENVRAYLRMSAYSRRREEEEDRRGARSSGGGIRGQESDAGNDDDDDIDDDAASDVFEMEM